MLIVPVEKTVDWSKPPFATFSLIFFNSLLLALASSGSERHTRWVHSYGFIPLEHRPLTFFTHAFLHGDFGHLLGNMVFLFLVGVVVENILGAWLYLTFYFISGFSAAGLFWLLNSDSSIPLVGASGCISGVMGLYAALFWMRRIRFFYNLAFYFNYASAPASILLPVWLGNEYIQMSLHDDSHIAYAAHMGGLAGGGFLGVCVKLWRGKVDTAYLDAQAKTEARGRRLEEGNKRLQALELEQAAAIFRDMLAADPDDAEVLLQLYRTAKFKPQTQEYRNLAMRILESPAGSAIALRNIVETYSDYVRFGLPPLQPKLLLSLAARFCRSDYQETAERIAEELFAQGRRDAELGDILLNLAGQCNRKGHAQGRERYLRLLAQEFEACEAGTIARRMLNS